MPRHIHASARVLVPLVLAVLLPIPSVRSEARITGDPDAMRIEARNASIEEVMAALSASFGLRYQGTVSAAPSVTGTYEGSLQRVVAKDRKSVV